MTECVSRSDNTRVSRFCEAAHPAGFASTDNDKQTWEFEMSKDPSEDPRVLDVDFKVWRVTQSLRPAIVQWAWFSLACSASCLVIFLLHNMNE